MRGQRHSRKPKQYITIKLDDIPDLRKGAHGAYADKIVIIDDNMFVIEEAKSIRKRDLEQLVKTIKDLQYGDLKVILRKYNYDLPESKPKAGILHKRGGKLDFITDKLRAIYMKRLKVSIFVANCNDDLNDLIDRLLAR